MNPVLETLRRHASCRDYAADPVPDDVLTELVRVAQQASTDATGQLYSLLRLKDPDLRRDVGVLAGNQSHVHAAPELFIVLLDTRRLRLLLEHRGERFGMRSAISLLFGLTDAALFAQNLVIAAESLGYGTCYLGGVQNNACEIARRLALPQGVVPLYGLTMGRPTVTRPPKPRIPTQLVLHTDHYQDPSSDQLRATYEEMSKATRSGDWLNPIRKYFATNGIMEGREEEFRALLRQQGLPLETIQA